MTIAPPLAWMLGLLLGSPVRGDEVEYGGKYASDPAFKRTVASIPGLRRKALGAVKKRLEIEPKRSDRIRIEVRDALPAEPETLAPTTHAPFETFTDGGGPDAPIVIRIHAEFVKSGQYDLAQELAHEMVHAVMRERMSADAYSRIPKWLREGLALWAAGQGPTRVAWILSSREALDGLQRFGPGSDSETHEFDRYASDFFAIETLAEKEGPEAVVELVRALIQGEEAQNAIESACGLDFNEFRNSGFGALQSAAAFDPPDGWPEYGEISRHDRNRRYLDVIATADEFERKHRRSLVLGDVLYFKGKAQRLTVAHEDAAKTLARLTAPGALPCHFADEALYQLGRVELDMGRHADAASRFEAIVRDFPDTSLLDPAAFWLAFALAGLDRKEDALRWLDRFERSFPESELAADARSLRAQLK